MSLDELLSKQIYSFLSMWLYSRVETRKNERVKIPMQEAWELGQTHGNELKAPVWDYRAET